MPPMRRRTARTAALLGVGLYVLSGVLYTVLEVTVRLEQPHAPGEKVWERIAFFLCLLFGFAGFLSFMVSVSVLAYNRLFHRAPKDS